MKTILKLALVVALGVSSTSAAPIILSTIPSAAQVAPGDPLLVALTISGLTAGGAPSLGAWIIDISYNPAVFSITDSDVTFGSLLGAVPAEASVGVDTTTTPGLVALNQTSFLSTAALDALQPADFTLATLEFTGVAPGTSTFDFAAADLADAMLPSASLTVDGTAPGSAEVVPEPSTLTLFGIGAAALLVVLRKRKRRA